MSLTFGFYNSSNHDRRYDALQLSSIFDGVIKDGIFMSIGNTFTVKAKSGMGIVVETGRAWFDHTWTLNDAPYPMDMEQSDLILNRIDAVVLETDSTVPIRANSLKVIKGVPASNPLRPTLTKSERVNQYPLAYISIKKGVVELTQSDVTNMVGTSECPFVTGILETVNIDNLVAQWETEWREWIANNTSVWNEWKSANASEFNMWFEHMKGQLSEDAAGNLQQQIDNILTAIDCGTFANQPIDAIAFHNVTARAHPLMMLDGNVLDNISDAHTLEEHMQDPTAHGNLIVDGNMN